MKPQHLRKPTLILVVLWMTSLLPVENLSAQQGTQWPEITRETKPWTRWWWHASAVDSANITWNLEQIVGAGFGGVEITPIYGAKGQEHRFIPYLSERWIRLFNWTVEECNRLGMGVDMPPGTGWRTGGPWVELKDADSKLLLEVEHPVPGKKWKHSLKGKRVLTVMAYGTYGSRDISDRIKKDSMLVWKVAPGTQSVYIAGLEFRGGYVKRPAPGGEGYSISPYSKAAFQRFLDEYSRRASFPAKSLRAWFHDSFEYVGDACPAIFERFREIQGYDLRQHLPALNGEGDPEEILGVQADYREVLGRMVLEDFSYTLRDWANQQGSLFKNQAHGSPGNLLDLYAAADIPETEIFGVLSGPDADRLINQFASSAAHVEGKPLASSESCTWLGEHFTVGLDSMKAAIDHLFLSGINHVAFHGTVYSPTDIPWPGWLFYASVQMNPQNPLWREAPVLNQYITRCQSILQNGTPDNDILLYWPYYDAIHGEAPLKKQLAVHHPDWFYNEPVSKTAVALEEYGFAFDYISDRQLGELSVSGGKIKAKGGEYQTIIVPSCEYLPVETAAHLLKLAQAGANIIFEDNLPASAPGWHEKEARSENLRKTLDQIRAQTSVSAVDNATEELIRSGFRRETMVEESGLEFIRRDVGLGTDYLIVNQAKEDFEGWITLASPANLVFLMDPMTGQTGKAKTRDYTRNSTSVWIQIPAKGSLIIRTSLNKANARPWNYSFHGKEIPLKGEWKVDFIAGGAELPPSYKSSDLNFWTTKGAEYEAFSGTAQYSLTFDNPGTNANYELNLGNVEKTATVYLNGKKIGTRVIAPFTYLLTDLKAQGNLLEIEMTNLAANRIRDLDQKGVVWKNFYDINFVNIDYKKFDASDWEVYPSGLSGPVTLTPQPEKVYAFSYFMGNGEDGLHLALSTDGKNWEAVNGGRSLLQPLVGESVLMRDPCITRGPDGEFHMVWTTAWGGHTIGYAHSPDLIHWSEQKAIPVMAHEPTAQNCWAPEIVYDEKEKHFLVYWSTTIPGRFPKTDKSAKGGRNHRMYYFTTRDFKTISPTQLFYDRGFNVIDGSMIEENGRYAMFLKNESLYPRAQKNIRIAWADQPTGPWSDASEPITGDYWAEGPTAMKIEGRWHLYFDKYRKHEYGLLTSADLVNWEDESGSLKMPDGIRHGTIFEITPQEAMLLQHTKVDLPMLYRDETKKGRPYAKDPAVVKYKGKYWMYHSLPPREDGRPAGGWIVGIASSTDLHNWKKEGEILPVGGYEKKGLAAPEAIVLRDTIHLFYQTYGNARKDAICHAWSVDGINFHRNPSNPIFAPTGDWNIGRAIDAEVFPFEGKLYLYWASRDTAYKQQLLGVSSAPLYSDYGRDKWTQISTEPLLKPDLPWEMNCIEAASICEHDGKLYMFYAGAYNHETQQIGCAVSTDAVHWTRISDQPVLPKGPAGSWNSTESGHPGVFQDENGDTWLFFQGNPDHGQTYYLSKKRVEWGENGPIITD